MVMATWKKMEVHTTGGVSKRWGRNKGTIVHLPPPRIDLDLPLADCRCRGGTHYIGRDVPRFSFSFRPWRRRRRPRALHRPGTRFRPPTSPPPRTRPRRHQSEQSAAAAGGR